MLEFIPEYETQLTRGMFDDAIERVKKKNPQKYAFIIRGGNSLKNSLFSLFQKVWTLEKIPEEWNRTDIVQIHKSKGSFKELGNYRNIHTKTDTRKLFGEIVTHKMKETYEARLRIAND